MRKRIQIGPIAGLIAMFGSPAAATNASTPGEYLARLGNCVVCHTAPGGKPFAGGLKMSTPVGVIYTTNITPDQATGIGNYSLEEFGRAVRQGIAKDGRHLYPAMPYPSYAKVGDDDIQNLYEFFINSVTPVDQPNRPNDLHWPLNMRWPLALWNTLMTGSGTYKPNPRHDADWNRGAYIVQGLGHCGACHTPRGWAFQEKALDQSKKGYLTGGELDNWSAVNLTGDSNTGLGRWTEADIADFLKTGRNSRAAAFGTMTDTINYSTQEMTDADRAAIAKYLKSLPPAVDGNQPAYAYNSKTADALNAPDATQPGAAIYLLRCEACHARDGQGRHPSLPTLAGNPVVLDRDPSSLINIVLNGSTRLVVGGVPDIYRMAPFRAVLSDENIAQVVSYIRSAWGNDAPSVLDVQVGKVRAATSSTSDLVTFLHMR